MFSHIDRDHPFQTGHLQALAMQFPVLMQQSHKLDGSHWHN